MKIAYIFFGQVKNFERHQFDAFRENVQSKICDHDIEYHLVTSKRSKYGTPRQQRSEGTENAINHHTIKKYFDFKNIFYDELDSIDCSEIEDLAENLVSNFGGAWGEDSLQATINSLKQIYSLEFFHNQFSKLGEDYDAYILSRSDLFHTHPIDADCLSRDGDIFIPYYDALPQIDYGWFGGVNDRFAIIKNQSTLKTYCTRYSSIKNNPQFYHAEKYLKQKLESAKTDIQKIHNFEFKFLRGNGKITDQIGIYPDANMNTNLNKISKSFFINLDRRTDRLNHINNNLPFFANRFSAVDGNSAKLDEEVKTLFPKTWQKRTKAEICCAISHYRLWKQLVFDNDAHNYLILEDDVVFKPGVEKFWNDAFSHKMPSDFSIIYLGGCQPWNRPHYHKVLQKHNEYFCTVKKNDYFTTGDHFWHMNASSYVISRQAAMLICQWVEQQGMDEALDNFMQNFFNKNKLFTANNSIYHLNPLIAYQLHEEGDNFEADKNSDIRHAKERFQEVESIRDEPKIKKEQEIINLHYWPGPQSGERNFGDELSAFIIKKLLPFSHFHFNQNPDNYEKNLIGIGSYMHKARDGFYVFGSGVRKLTHSCYCKDLSIISTRGPCTQEVLKSKNIDCPSLYGDPALFISRYYQPKKDNSLKDKIGFVPHIFDNEDYCMDESFHIINPTLPWSQVVNQICSCKAILSSSLHGLICADAYSVPNAWLKCKTLEDGEFKFKDYFLSQGRDFKFLSTVEDLDLNSLYRGGNNINLDKISEALFSSKLLEPKQSIAIVYRIPRKHREKYVNWRDGFTEACKLLSSVYNVDFHNIEDGIPDLVDYHWVFVKEGFDGNIFKSIKDKIKDSKIGIFISSSGSIPSQQQLDEFDIIFYETDWYFNYANLNRHQNAYKAFGVDHSLIEENKITKKDIDYLFVGSIVGYKRPWEILKYEGVKVCVGEIVDYKIKSFLEKNGVLVISFVDYKSLMNLYARSKNCIVPCELHGGGERAVLESRACGVPVLVMQDNPKLKELIGGKIYSEHDYATSIHNGIKMFKDGYNIDKINPTAVRHHGIEYVLYRTESYPQNCPAYYRASSGKKINFYRSNAGYQLKIGESKTIDCAFDFGDYSYVKSKMIDLAGTSRMKIEDVRFVENTIESNNGELSCLACCTILSDIDVFEGQKKEDGSWDEKKPIGLKLKTSPGICRVNLNTGEIQYIRTLTNQSDDIQKNWLMFKHDDLYYCLYSMFPLLYCAKESIEQIEFSQQEKRVVPKMHNATCPIKIDDNSYAMICHSERQHVEQKPGSLPWAYKKYFVSFDLEDGEITNIYSQELDNIKPEYYCSSILKDGDRLKVFAGVEDVDCVEFSVDIPRSKKSKPTHKLIFTQKNLFEQDFLLELFDDVEIVYDVEMTGVYENACIVYSDIYHRDSNVYKNEEFRKTLNQQKQKLFNFLNQQKNCCLVHLSDEHRHANIDHYKNFKHVFRQYYRSDAAANNVTFIPLGYKSGFHDQ